MSTWAIIGITICTFAAMEGVAWATHRFVMHGFLWRLHSDHHKKDHDGPLERNDVFFLLFAIPSMALFAAGAVQGTQAPWTWIGLGILLYGIAYFLVHEVFIHQRIAGLRTTRNAYFLALRRAHKAHHKRPARENGVCFGMLLVPLRYYREARAQLRREATA
ncbi:MAG: sterol desaturase family protein [Flavobacteriales bacterium]